MGKKKKSKKKNRVGEIFNSIRKPMPPKGGKFKTRKNELERKAKHKNNGNEDS